MKIRVIKSENGRWAFQCSNKKDEKLNDVWEFYSFYERLKGKDSKPVVVTYNSYQDAVDDFMSRMNADIKLNSDRVADQKF